MDDTTNLEDRLTLKKWKPSRGEMDIFGFSILRNAIKYDYPFKESLNSLSGLTRKVYLTVGDGQDDTADQLEKLKKLDITHSIWDEDMRQGGEILSQQTNISLKRLKKDQANPDTWGLYLQADEVINEEDYTQIIEDITFAEAHGFDAVSFRYLHFWQDYTHIAIDKRWYPNEIRAIKLNSQIESFGDAQSFRNTNKIHYSDAHIFHYGHVRKAAAYEQKKRDFHKFWHPDDQISQIVERAKIDDSQEKCLLYYGTHAAVMKERIENFTNTDWQLPTYEKPLFLVGNPENFDPIFLDRINASDIQWINSIKELPKGNDHKLVVMEKNSWLNKIARPETRSIVPYSMSSKRARPWTKEFRATLKLSEKAISLKKSVDAAQR